MEQAIHRIFSWFERNERHISAPFFVFGFINDIFTVGLLPLAYAIPLYGAYLIGAALAAIGAHFLYVRRGSEGWKLRSLRTALSLLAQFLTGGLISGCLIFYTKNAAIVASWPFIAVLIAVFVGNEFLRKYREALAFRNIVFFFTLYAYLIFAIPFLEHQLNRLVFIESTVATIILFALYLLFLRLAGKERFAGSLRITLVVVALIIAFLNISYFTGIIPPLPLAIREISVYQSVSRVNGAYVLTGENTERPWWDLFAAAPVTVQHVPGTPLSVFSSVFAPTSFSTGIVHEWQSYDPATHRWHTVSTVEFNIQGGRDGGYRGYSTMTNLTPGKYRVSVKTLSGLVIGRLYFNVVFASTSPQTITTYE